MENTILDLSTNFKIRSILFFNIALSIYVLYSNFTWNWLLISYVIGWFFGGIGISICYHRLYAHNSFETYKIVEYILLFIGTLASVGSAITWVGIHRDHHANSDTNSDPHSPKYNGFFRTLFHVWKKYDIKPRFIKSLIKKPELKIQHEYYFTILLSFIILMLVIFGTSITAYIYSMPAVFVFVATGLVNSVNHWGGKPNNFWLLNIITSGESYHLNHHKNVRAWSFGLLDPMTPIIKVIKK